MVRPTLALLSDLSKKAAREPLSPIKFTQAVRLSPPSSLIHGIGGIVAYTVEDKSDPRDGNQVMKSFMKDSGLEPRYVV
jgi:hypothetical protein